MPRTSKISNTIKQHVAGRRCRTVKVSYEQSRKRIRISNEIQDDDWIDVDQTAPTSASSNSSDPNPQCMQEDQNAPRKSRYAKASEEFSKAWRDNRRNLYNSYSKIHHRRGVCQLCNEMESSLRCNMCGLREVCTSCMNYQHRHNPLHVVEQWNGKYFKRTSDTLTCHIECSFGDQEEHDGTYLIDAVFFTEDAEELNVKLHMCRCTTTSQAMLHLGYWPLQAVPERAHVPKAVSIRLLFLMESLRQCTSASLFSICKALELHKTPMWNFGPVNLYRHLNTFGAFRAFEHFVDDIRWSAKVDCPACYVQPDCNESQPCFLLLDGCFGIRHRKTAGGDDLSSAPKTDIFLDVDFQKKTEPKEEHCSNWTAGGRGQALSSSSDIQRLDVFGCFCGSCRHGCIRYLADMTTPGEKLNYACTMVAQALEDVPSPVPLIVSYDVACKLQGHFAVDRMKFAVPAFHAYGHVYQCQIKQGIRYTNGAGLTDGESCESLWSIIRRYGPQVKEMTHYNRRQFLSHMANSINFQKLLEISTWLKKRLVMHHRMTVIVEKDIVDFLKKHGYADTTSFDALAEQWDAELRVTSNSEQSIQRSSKVKVISRLHQLACEREFLIRHSVTERGQKLAKRLRIVTSVSIRKSNRIIRSYNAKVPTVRKLRFEDFSHPNSAGFAALNPVEYAPRMEAVRLWHLRQRVAEESMLVSAEARRVTHFLSYSLSQTSRQIDEASGQPMVAILSARYDGLIYLLRKNAQIFPEQQLDASVLPPTSDAASPVAP